MIQTYFGGEALSARPDQFGRNSWSASMGAKTAEATQGGAAVCVYGGCDGCGLPPTRFNEGGSGGMLRRTVG